MSPVTYGCVLCDRVSECLIEGQEKRKEVVKMRLVVDDGEKRVFV